MRLLHVWRYLHRGRSISSMLHGCCYANAKCYRVHACTCSMPSCLINRSQVCVSRSFKCHILSCITADVPSWWLICTHCSCASIQDVADTHPTRNYLLSLQQFLKMQFASWIFFHQRMVVWSRRPTWTNNNNNQAQSEYKHSLTFCVRHYVVIAMKSMHRLQICLIVHN